MSSILQAGGRGGRTMADGGRRKVIVYLLYNRTDVRANAGHISVDVRNFYNSNLCTKEMLHNYFSDGDAMSRASNWCCEAHH